MGSPAWCNGWPLAVPDPEQSVDSGCFFRDTLQDIRIDIKRTLGPDDRFTHSVRGLSCRRSKADGVRRIPLPEEKLECEDPRDRRCLAGSRSP